MTVIPTREGNHGTAGRPFRGHRAGLGQAPGLLRRGVRVAVVDRGANSAATGGGIGEAPEGYDGHATFYVAVPDVEAALAQVERLGGSRIVGPEEVMDGLVVGLFTDREGHVLGVVNGG